MSPRQVLFLVNKPALRSSSSVNRGSMSRGVIHDVHILGSRVRLECKAGGQPSPNIYWNRQVENLFEKIPST